jgi:hypothetical protein
LKAVDIIERLEKEFSECIAEKRVWHWALTQFVVEVWGKTGKQDSETQIN